MSAPTDAEPSRHGLVYQPALDGVRAVAVTLVVLFHLGLSWMPGGYLGVSVFFTLSGFLITSLLLHEFHRDGRVSFRRFYARRAKRLLPAGMACLLFVVVARSRGEFALVPGLRADLMGALLQVFNWVQVAGGSSYAALFGQSAMFTSPLAHYWSLAIEEQFYLVWPVTLVGLCAWRARRQRTVVRPLLVLTVVFAAAAPVIATRWGADAAYWSTPSRLGELLVGATAAAWLRTGPSLRPSTKWWAPVGLVVIVVCCLTFPSGSGPAFTGWLTPFAVVSAALVVGLQAPGPVRSLLSVTPLVWLGRASYGLYLIHWPVFVLLRQHGWDLTTTAGAAVAVSVTLAVTTTSYWLLERPVRRSSWSPAVTGRRACALAAAVLAVVVAMPVSRGFLQADPATMRAAAIDTAVPLAALRPIGTVSPQTSTTTTKPASTTPATEPTSTETASTETGSTETASTETASTEPVVDLPLPPAPSRPVRVLVVGDSTAFYVGLGLAGWAVQHPPYAQVDLTWCQGCGFILDGTITSFDGASFVASSRTVVQQTVPERVALLHPDVVVLMVSIDDMADRSWDMGEGVLTPRDERFRARMYAQYRSVTESLLAMGVPDVVWVVPPVPRSQFEARDLRETDRYQRQHEVIRQVAGDVAVPPGSAVTVCDMDDWLRRSGNADDPLWRPDGTHLTEQSAGWLADRWLGPWLVSTATGGYRHAP